MKVFKAITGKGLYYSIFHTLFISVSAIAVGVMAMNSDVSSNVDLRFIGPVALFMLILSIVFTLFPFTLLRAKAGAQLKKSDKTFIKDFPKVFLIIEAIITAFLLLSYIGAMSGSMWGGVGLILLSALNLIGVAISAVIIGVGFGMNKYSDESLKYKVNSLTTDSRPILNYDDIKAGLKFKNNR